MLYRLHITPFHVLLTDKSGRGKNVISSFCTFILTDIGYGNIVKNKNFNHGAISVENLASILITNVEIQKREPFVVFWLHMTNTFYGPTKFQTLANKKVQSAKSNLFYSFLFR